MDEELANIEKQVEEVKAKAGDKKALIILTTGGKVSAYGTGSRFGLIHDVLGVPAADPNLKVTNPHGQSVSFEYIAEKIQITCLSLTAMPLLKESRQPSKPLRTRL